MNQNQWLKQMIDFNKTAFENAFGSVTLLQEQAEKLTGSCIEQAPWMPQAGKTAIGEWMKACKQLRDSFKSSVDEGFKKAESHFTDRPKSE
mgnify:CR=1 FL=1